MTEKEWRMFNDILLEIYYAGSLETFGERCLKLEATQNMHSRRLPGLVYRAAAFPHCPGYALPSD